MECPCRYCTTDRKLYCHDNCKRYKLWKKRHDERNAEIREAKKKLSNGYVQR